MRSEITLGSLYIADCENSLGIDPHDACEFFDGFIEKYENRQQDTNSMGLLLLHRLGVLITIKKYNIMEKTIFLVVTTGVYDWDSQYEIMAFDTCDKACACAKEKIDSELSCNAWSKDKQEYDPTKDYEDYTTLYTRNGDTNLEIWQEGNANQYSLYIRVEKVLVN